MMTQMLEPMHLSTNSRGKEAAGHVCCCGVFGAAARLLRGCVLIGAAQLLWRCRGVLWATLSVCQRHEWCTERVVLAGAAILCLEAFC